MDFIKELKWRGMLHDMMPGTEDQLKKEMTVAYMGFDPTSESLHIGNLSSLMLLKHFQLAGHKPVVLIGGATGMVGDPSGKSEERVLLDEETLRKNQEGIRKQLLKFLDFDSDIPNKAEIVNNYDWTKDFTLLGFLRDIGKHITVNYMMAKDSVKKRLETGLSFTEFSYQLLQGYDFLYLYEKYNCRLQMGGSDQWGNIVTGTELIRRKTGGEAFAVTNPLITKSDGGKFGKTEQGNVWLDKRLTSPYKFYQFWLNVADEDAEYYIKVFTLLKKDEIQELITRHKEEPHNRLLQKRLATEVTLLVHSEEDLNTAIEASQILFGKSAMSSLKKIDEDTFLSVFEGVPQYDVAKKIITTGVNILDLLTGEASVFQSKGELRRLISGGGLSINKEKVTDPDMEINLHHLLNDKYILVQKGKKGYYIIRTV